MPRVEGGAQNPKGVSTRTGCRGIVAIVVVTACPSKWRFGGVGRSQISDLGHLGGGFSQAYDLASGSWGLAIVGRSFTSGGPITDMAFLWRPGIGMTGLGGLGGRWSWALGISRNGQVVVGTSWLPPHQPGIRHAFRWEPVGGMVDLGVLPGGSWSQAHACTFDGTTIVG